jgi:hypothetical protein
LAELNRAIITTAATAESRLDSTYSFMIAQRVSTPENRTARSFEPIMVSVMPNGERFSMIATGTAQARNTSSPTGTPSTTPLPMNTTGAGKPEMMLPRVSPMAMPLTTDSMPRVARIGETLR